MGSTKKIKVDFDTYEECIGWAVKYGLDLSKHSPSYYGATKKWQWEWEISALDDDHKTPDGKRIANKWREMEQPE